MNEICRYGLNPELIKESLFAVVTHNLFETKLHYFLFPEIQKDEWKIGAITKYDIPQYIEGMPDGFSAFCTIFEAREIKKYQQISEKPENKIENYDTNKEIFEIEPKPSTEYKYCYICNIKYEEYSSHINNQIHFDNLLKYKNIFNRINMTFERISKYWIINNNLLTRIDLNTEKEKKSLLSKELEINIDKDKNHQITEKYYLDNSKNKINYINYSNNNSYNNSIKGTGTFTSNIFNKNNKNSSNKNRFVQSLSSQNENKNSYNDDSNEKKELEERNVDISDVESYNSNDICKINYLNNNSQENNDNSFSKEEIIEINSDSENSEEIIKILNSKKRMRSESSEIEYKMTYEIYGIKPTKKVKYLPDD